MKAPVVTVARCPEHGLHGERDDCFVCGGEVEQVALLSAERVRGEVDALVAGAEVVRGVDDVVAVPARLWAAFVLRYGSGQLAPDAPAETWEDVEWADLRAGDVVSLLVFGLQEGWERERRRVVEIRDGGRVLLAEGDREYEFDPATDPHREDGPAVVKRQLRRLVAE